MPNWVITVIVLIVLVQITTCNYVNTQVAKPTVAIVNEYSNYDSTMQQLANQLQSTGNFSRVDFIGSSQTSSVSSNLLSKYQAIFVLSYGTSSFGTVLDQTLHLGKTGIVGGGHTIQNTTTLSRASGWSTSDQIMSSANAKINFGNDYLDNVLPNHPILRGVANFSMQSHVLSSMNLFGDNSILISQSTVGTLVPVVATKKVNGKFRRVDLNIFYAYGNVNTTYKGSGAIQLLANSLLWASGFLTSCEDAQFCDTCNIQNTATNKCAWCPISNTCVNVAANTCRSSFTDPSLCPTRCGAYTTCQDCSADSDCVYCVKSKSCEKFVPNDPSLCQTRIGSPALCPS